MSTRLNFSMLLCFITTVCTSLFAQENNTTPSDLFPSEKVVTRYHNDWTIKNYQSRIATFEKDVPEFGDVFFIGNSITQQGNDWNEKFELNHIKNRGIAGDVTDGVIARLNEIVYYKPKAVFILIGINDLFNLHHDVDNSHNLKYDKIIPSAKYVGKNIIKISKIIHEKSPNTKIFVRTVLPTTRSFLKDEILEINKMIKKGAHKGFYSVVDLYSVFVDESGFMQKELTKDGVHLNDKGYQQWVAFEKPILLEFYK
ncbi:GDSL-type esterase/lipase family protein [Wenyingzhuangia marina]|uniref:Lysophospholipase L1 n=1 Tax=Wenyingzhuangia marina TaxID=1195760 RepID=A0A1M5VKV5_9FLAO|nr:GDSL-type esterase/lipase family protein [Wenyingzhuangia marina]GGF71594.1 sialate O-acetylesterase [Wenyingzhuangia marina]SHH75674.1 Lysophospholipase L1 [Wenyingzhuangia marina]